MAEKLVFELTAVDRATAPLRSVQQQVTRTTAAVRDQASAYNSTAVATNKWAKGALQQAGFQVGDFFVQVTNGTSALQAFGQQGSQLLGIFGPIGAVLGAGVAIFSAVAIAFQRASGSAESLAEKGDKLFQSYSKLDELKFTGFSEAARQALAEFQPVIDFLEGQEMKRLKSGLEEIKMSFAPDPREMARAKNDLDDQLDIIQSARQLYGDQSEIVKQLREEFSEANLVYQRQVAAAEAFAAISGDTRIELIKSLQAEMQRLTVANMMTEEMRTAFETLLNSVDTTGALADEAGRVSDESETTADETERAAKAAAELSAEFAKAAAAVMSINVAAKSKLSDLQAELRARMRGLTDEQVRIQMAAREAENAAIAAGVDSVAELAQISGEAANIERAIIEAESGLAQFSRTAKAMPGIPDKVVQQFDALRQISKDISSTIERNMESAFMSIVDGTKSTKDAFKSMAASIIQELYRVFVVQRIVQGVSSAVNLLAFGLGSFRANGGPVNARQSYVVGEKGPELFVPSRSGHIIPNDQMGSKGESIVINQTINVSAGVAQTVRAEIRQMMPMLAENAKAAVLDAKRRGGSYGRAFA